MNERNSIIGRIDWVTLLIYLALVMIGWFSIFSARYNEAHPSIFDMLDWCGLAYGLHHPAHRRKVF